MRLPKMLIAAAALSLAMVGAAPAFADTTDTANFELEITAGSELSVEITSSNNFPDVAFSLAGPPNWTASAFYNMKVVDMRGTGAGWTVTGSASPFTPAIPGAALQQTNNTLWSGLCSPAGTFCAAPGSISNGVAHYASSPNVMGTTINVMWSAAGTTPAPAPYGTGTFTMQNVVYYNNIPDALAVGVYTTTLTLSIAGLAP